MEVNENEGCFEDVYESGFSDPEFEELVCKYKFKHADYTDSGFSWQTCGLYILKLRLKI